MGKQIDLEISVDAIAERNGITVDEVRSRMDRIKKTLLPFEKQVEIVEEGNRNAYSISRGGAGPLITSAGKFYLFDFHIDDSWGDYEVIYKGDLDDEKMPLFGDKPLLLRIDSGCGTGQKYGDLTCECKDQLIAAMRMIEENGSGMIIHIPEHEGRGKGLPFKLATLALEDELKVNTVEAAAILAKDIDVRTYGGAIGILKFFRVKEGRIDVITNNPEKTKVFAENGYVVNMVDIVIAPNEHTEMHLIAKEKLLGHRNLIRR